MKKFIYYIFLFLFIPFIPLVLFSILFYRYIIIYLWLFLDIIFKDLLKFKDYSIYDNIQKYFKYIFYEFFFEVIPLLLWKYLKKLNFKYLFYFLVQIILKIQSLFLKLIVFFISNLPIWFVKCKYIFFNLIKNIKNWLKKIKIYIFFNQYKLKKFIYLFYYVFFDFIFILKFILLYLYLYLISFIKYFYLFDKLYLIILSASIFRKYIFVINKISENSNFINKLFIILNLFKLINKTQIILIINNNYLLIINYYFNKLLFIEIKNILLFNNSLKTKKLKIKNLFNKFLWLYEYLIIYWLLNRLLNKKNYLIFLFLKNILIFNRYFKLIKYYIIKLIK